MTTVDVLAEADRLLRRPRRAAARPAELERDGASRRAEGAASASDEGMVVRELRLSAHEVMTSGVAS